MLEQLGFHMFKKMTRNYASDESGVFAVIAAFMFLTIMGFVALGVDVSQWMMQKRSLQTAADAGALAAAYELANGLSNNDAEAAALKEAKNNGYNPAAASASISTVIDPNGNGTGIATVQVSLQEAAQGWFTTLLGGSTIPTTGVSATAAEQVAGSGQFCMLALGNSGTVITTSGNVTLDATSCGIAANSTSQSALQMNGNVTIDVGAVSLAGDYSGGRNFSYSSLKVNTGKQIADPYASFTPDPEPYTCSAADQSNHVQKTFGSTYVYCGGFTPAGNLSPGVYYVDGGDFGANGGNITGNGVTIVLTNSGGANYGSYGNVVFHGNASLSLTAPTTGTTAGVAIYMDRNSPSSCGVDISGNDSIQINGVLYAPSCGVDIGGNTGANGAAGLCTEVISKTITYHGTPSIGTDCVDDPSVKPIGVTYTVQLTE